MKNTIIQSDLLQKSWPLATKHESRIIATKIKLLRRIVGKTRRDKWRNNRI
jgi:hypothetical protein